jgi:hypothetical protein
MSIEVVMRKIRKSEVPEERTRRLLQEAQLKRDEAAANDDAVDRTIRRSIEQYGP